MEDNLVDIITWKCYIGMLALLSSMDVKHGSFKKPKLGEYLLITGTRKNVSSMIVNIPSTLVECGGHSKYVQRKLVICSSYRNCNLKTCYKELYCKYKKRQGKHDWEWNELKLGFI